MIFCMLPVYPKQIKNCFVLRQEQLGGNESTGRITWVFQKPQPSENDLERVFSEPLQKRIKLLLDCFLASLGCISISVNAEAFLRNILDLLSLKLRLLECFSGDDGRKIIGINPWQSWDKWASCPWSHQWWKPSCQTAWCSQLLVHTCWTVQKAGCREWRGETRRSPLPRRLSWSDLIRLPGPVGLRLTTKAANPGFFSSSSSSLTSTTTP